MEDKLNVRKATVADVRIIHSMLLDAARKGELLGRALTYLYGHIRNFFVVVDGENRILGCVALAPLWEDLAEVCSLVVREELRGRGAGRLLVEACIEDCRKLGINKVFALTLQDQFFHHMGFSTVDKDAMPQKIWADCVNCPKYPDCDEYAVLRDVPLD